MGKQPIRFCYCCGIFHLGKLRARFGQTSGQVRANFGLGSGKLRARFGQTSGQVRANFGLGSGKLRARFGQTSGQVRANFGLGSGKLDILTTSNAHQFLSLDTIGCPQQPLIQWVIIGNLKFEGYFGILYLLWVVHCLKTLKFHHCLSLVTTGCPQQPLIQWVIIGNLKLE